MSEVQEPSDIAQDVNVLLDFLAHDQIPDLSESKPVDCIIICASAVLHQASTLFAILEKRPSLTKTFVLVGGIGHSTSLIYDAVARHPKYHTIHDQIVGLPEAKVLLKILENFFNLTKIESGGCRILLEDRSTNCGANAIETRRALERAQVTGVNTCVVIQDQTMSLRTIAGFDKAFEDLPDDSRPHFIACPIFVPKLRVNGTDLEYVLENDEFKAEDLWETRRLCELLVGEITRLKDDENGYGPKGKGFIGHVCVPLEVENAAIRVREQLGVHR
ncbi:hypothetical protein Q7P37_005975 [Cladosporium fusiforme]